MMRAAAVKSESALAGVVSDPTTKPHRRVIGWLGTSALGMGGSNQSIFLLAALFAGQGDIPGQGSAAVVLLVIGLLLSFAAAPGWLELVLMYPNRVGGIAASCTAAFKPYSEILSVLAGVCYWWGWVPTCGLTAIFSASAIHQWLMPGVPIDVIAITIVLLFLGLNLLGIRPTTRFVVIIATISSILAFLSAIVPVLSGTVDWQQASTYHLNTPFDGWFGELTAIMAGLYLIGFGAPAFEAATCHVGETIDQNRNVPRAMLANAVMAGLYFAVLPVVWLGALGAGPLGGDLSQTLGPLYAPWFGSLGSAMALWFIMFNMFHGTLQPLAGAARVLSQLSEDGLLPRFLALRTATTDVPWAAATVTAAFSIWFLLMGDPIWLVAAANFTYLIGIALPNVAVWLLRYNAPDAVRPWRAPRYTIGLGLAAAVGWGVATTFGFQQFGLPTVVFGLGMAYSGVAFYAWRKIEDRKRVGQPTNWHSLHVKLTGAMLLVLGLDAVGYIIAVGLIADQQSPVVVLLEDIFVVVAMLTISVGVVLPGMVAHSADQVSEAAAQLVRGTLRDFSNAMLALGRGDLESAYARVDVRPVEVKSKDEVGQMAANFNMLQNEIENAAFGLDGARTGLGIARAELLRANQSLTEKVAEQQQYSRELQFAKDAAEAGTRAKSEFMATMSHELRTPLTSIIAALGIMRSGIVGAIPDQHRQMLDIAARNGDRLLRLINDILDIETIDAGKLVTRLTELDLGDLLAEAIEANKDYGQKRRVRLVSTGDRFPAPISGDHDRLMQVLANLLSNAAKFSPEAAAVEVSLSQHGNRFRASIKDFGPGVPADFHDKIFGRFAQADSSDARQRGGTGLGLNIAKAIVEDHGGVLGFVTEVAQGTTFYFELPARKD